jgi:hypothetical protein
MGRKPALITRANRRRAILQRLAGEREWRERGTAEAQALEAARKAQDEARKREEEEARARAQLEHKQRQEQMERDREAWAIETHKLQVYYHAVEVERERALRHRKSALDEFLESALQGR